MKQTGNRRLIMLLAVAVAAAGGGALQHFFDSTSSKSSHTASSEQLDLEVGEQNGGIAYGDTAKQVTAKLGRPGKKQSACWIYSAPDHTLHGEYLGKVIDAVRYCFADGPVGGQVVSTIYEHLIPSANASLPKDKQPAGGWIHAFYLASPGSEKPKS
jgi:hypothetical protein